MQTFPKYTQFRQGYDAGLAQVIWTKLVADLETPVSAMLKMVRGEPNSFLLESVEGGAIRGRYSILGMRPDLVWRCDGDKAEINRNVSSNADAFLQCPLAEKNGTMASLRGVLSESRIDLPDHLPPMAAGLVGYMSYDMVRLIEKLPDDNPDSIGVPDSIFLRPTIMAIFDSLEDTMTLVTPIWPGNALPKQAYQSAIQRLDSAINNLETPLVALHPVRTSLRSNKEQLKSNVTRDDFYSMVARAKDYIHAGDVFQVVPSQRFNLPFKLPPFTFYRSLRRLNPSPFLFYMDFNGFQIVGSSPEILVRVRDGRITLRPLAGTRKRGQTADEDAALAEDLLADPKERAEHLMLLDLGRNDVGRVAKVGSVKPTEQFAVEYYSHVMHIASNVEGDLDRMHFDEIDALMAGFPAGTVSGAPKVRAMEIIDELEPERRGIYAGCIGYFGADGDMDTCIALRTAVIKEEVIYIQAGAGVVADSEPESEFEETVSKAMALVRAAEEASFFGE
ncbi:MAG: anthranilate synthase component I [Rhodospirillaceae bacterium TMED8]|mgnify:CR=1 FL=1|nr:anthranilate synthase component I [Magnetovibrio sp.]OUT50904.1 MAG: anthranilate synthase component I [Rhodospirillaceae bacterium TMED8]